MRRADRHRAQLVVVLTSLGLVAAGCGSSGSKDGADADPWGDQQAHVEPCATSWNSAANASRRIELNMALMVGQGLDPGAGFAVVERDGDACFVLARMPGSDTELLVAGSIDGPWDIPGDPRMLPEHGEYRAAHFSDNPVVNATVRVVPLTGADLGLETSDPALVTLLEKEPHQ
jgi:hypothetical protein